MASMTLDHVNLRTARLDAMVEFYGAVLGLVRGPRPNFSFGGAWLYAGDRAVVHLVEVTEPVTPGQALSLQHFALRAHGLADFLERVAAFGAQPRFGRVEDFGLFQVNLVDPDGNHLHVDFALDEARALGLAPAGPSPVSPPREDGAAGTAPGEAWEAELQQGLVGLEPESVQSPAGLQSKPTILTSANGSSMKFLRRSKSDT